MTRLSGKPDLTKTQVQERSRRNRMRLRMRGMPNTKGTPNQPQKVKRVKTKTVKVDSSRDVAELKQHLKQYKKPTKESLLPRILRLILHRIFGEKWEKK